MSNAELATSYAALILADDGVEITVCFATVGGGEAGRYPRTRELTAVHRPTRSSA